MTYTKEEKQKYFKELRARWQNSKALADNDETAKALHREAGGNFSYYSFYFTLMDMKKFGYDGIPYVDCKTFKGWKDAGFIVKKGEKSKISGIVWLNVEDEKGNSDDDFVYPKVYHLFHRSQVEELKE